MRLHCNDGYHAIALLKCWGVPKQVDHEARRRLIAEALWRLTRAGGLEAVTLREVATEAGISMGLVQHYFDTKDEMLRFALEAIGDRVAGRINDRMIAFGSPAGPSDLVRAVLVELLPLDEERSIEAHVSFAFLARAAVTPAIAQQLREESRRLVDFLAGQIRVAAGGDDALSLGESAEEAESLLALVDGLAAHTLAGFETPGAALAVLDRRLAQIFPSRRER